jgi:hypothetical protein
MELVGMFVVVWVVGVSRNLGGIDCVGRYDGFYGFDEVFRVLVSQTKNIASKDTHIVEYSWSIQS